MAFTSKIGNILKRTVSNHIKSDLSASSPSMYQAIRCMSSSKLFVGGLSYSTDDQSLREAFTGYGEVIEARVIMDRETGRSRGFGFVSFTSGEEASAAITGMDGKIRVVVMKCPYNYKMEPTRWKTGDCAPACPKM